MSLFNISTLEIECENVYLENEIENDILEYFNTKNSLFSAIRFLLDC